jgi:hypothetical protein
MAVEAPVAGSTAPADVAHMPKLKAPAVPGDDSGHDLHVVADHSGRGVGDGMLEPEYAIDGGANGKGKKRSASPSDGNNVGRMQWYSIRDCIVPC